MGLRNRSYKHKSKIKFITTACYKKLPLLLNFKNDEIISECLNKFSEKYNIPILAYAIMSNHIHLLLYDESRDNFSKFMGEFKRTSSFLIRENLRKKNSDLIKSLHYINRNQKHKVWEDRFDDFSINRRKTFMIKLNYIHKNPVRAGLCELPEDYEFSSAHFYKTEIKGVVNIEHFVNVIGGNFMCNHGVLHR